MPFALRCCLLRLHLQAAQRAAAQRNTQSVFASLCSHEALDAATKGFKEALIEKLGADNVEFKEQNAGGDSATCSTITNGFVSEGVDLIFANATPALQAAMQSTPTIPIVGTSITDYATALDIDQSSWTGKTGINVTGSSDLAPLADQAAMFKELCPNAKTIGILYCSAEANSKYQADVVSSELTKLGYTVKVYTVADTNEIASVTTTACSEVDAIYVPTDNTLASATAAVNEIAEPAGIPIIAGEEGICKGAALQPFQSAMKTLVRSPVKWPPIFFKTAQTPQIWKSKPQQILQRNMLPIALKSLASPFLPIMLQSMHNRILISIK